MNWRFDIKIRIYANVEERKEARSLRQSFLRRFGLTFDHVMLANGKIFDLCPMCKTWTKKECTALRKESSNVVCFKCAGAV